MNVLVENVINFSNLSVPSCVRFGLPLPRGMLREDSGICLRCDGRILPAQTAVTSRWSDGSVRWLLVTTVAETAGDADLCLTLGQEDKAFEINEFDGENNKLLSHAKDVAVRKEDKEFPLFVLISDIVLSTTLKVSGLEQPVPLSIVGKLDRTDKLTRCLSVEGKFHFKDQKISFFCSAWTCSVTGEIKLSARLHNPNRAAHQSGLWDLGDMGSVNIDSFALTFSSALPEIGFCVKDDVVTENNDPLYISPSIGEKIRLTQYSSGGEHWQSPIHWDENKTLPFEENGFKFTVGRDVKLTGKRASPSVAINTANESLVVAMRDYWQNFPVKVSGTEGSVTWELFSEKTELQGGESKTWCFNCRVVEQEIAKYALVKDSGNSSSDVVITYDKSYLNRTGVFPHISFDRSAYLAELISLGLDGDRNFFFKREATDVYGWRDFGDIWADHEAVADTNAEYFVSHYNNQYDPLLGLTKQFLSTGDKRYLGLIKPLSQHIQDIDIYDTAEDKADYNGGLFWHTDHYLKAETCSHRSHSKYHSASYEGFLGGGGPGGQHCYTTGLALQYWLFGDERAKAKVVQLCNWIRCFYRGSGSMLDRTFRFLKFDLKKNVLTNLGFKQPGYLFPLDRGTGNFLVALLDTYELTSNIKLLEEAGYVVRNTIHPLEEVSQRNLQDFETTWFYTVFLQATARFLLTKEIEQQIDDDYWYARHSYMHYAEWMLNNEDFYLNHPDRLEFPNDTWCAQDIRKATIFCYAYYFAQEKQKFYLDKAKEFYQYIANHLSQSKEAQFTRIQALLLQNDGVEQRFLEGKRSPIPFVSPVYGSPPKFSPIKLILLYIGDIFKLLAKFSFKQEWHWIKSRL